MMIDPFNYFPTRSVNKILLFAGAPGKQGLKRPTITREYASRARWFLACGCRISISAQLREARRRKYRSIEAVGSASHDEVGGDLSEGGTALDTESLLAGEPKESFYARVLADHRNRIRREGSQPRPFALDAAGHDGRGERAHPLHRGGDHFVIRLRVARRDRLLIHRTKHQAARLRREINLIRFADDEGPSAHRETGRRREGDDGATARLHRDAGGAGLLRDDAGPRAGGVNDPSRGERSRIGEDSTAAALLDDEIAHFARGANHCAAAARMAQVAGQQFVHVDASDGGQDDRAITIIEGQGANVLGRLG